MKKLFLILLLIVLVPSMCWGLACFPGAEGYGTETRHAYAGSGDPVIYVVNTLSDNSTQPSSDTINGITVYTGSLRACIEDTTRISAGQGKIILFSVSGTITLAANDNIVLNMPYVFIAGQSAPSPGILVKGSGLTIVDHDVLMQHIRWRRGDSCCPDNCDNADALQVEYIDTNVYNVVIDHCSFSWAVDGNVDLYWDGVYDVTISNNIIAECLHDSCHGDGPHSTGMLVGPELETIAILRNLFLTNAMREPRWNSATGAIINNYSLGGWYDAPINMTDNVAGAPVVVAIIGNLAVPGPEDAGGEYDVNAEFSGNANGDANDIYFDKNECNDYVNDEWDCITGGDTHKVLSSPVSLTLMPTQWDGANVKYNLLQIDPPTSTLYSVGAWPDARDSADTRFVSEAVNESQVYFKDTVPEWPTIAENTSDPDIPSNPHSTAVSGYTNLEEKIHDWSQIAEGRYQSGNAPTLVSATISSDGFTLTLTFSENVNQGSNYADNEWDLDCTINGNDIGVTYVSGDGSASHIYKTSKIIYRSDWDTCNIDHNANDTADVMEDDSDNDLAGFEDAAVTNSSGMIRFAHGIIISEIR